MKGPLENAGAFRPKFVDRDVEWSFEDANRDLAFTSRELVLIAIDASRKITEYALDYALTNVVKEGDKVVLLAILPSPIPTLQGWKIWGSSQCAALPVGSGEEELKLLHLKCNRILQQQLSKFQIAKKVSSSVRIMQHSSKGIVASEANRCKATWIILDKNLKREVKQCFEETRSNLVFVNDNTPRILRLNLKQSTRYDENSVDTSSLLLDGLSMSMMPKGFEQLHIDSVLNSAPSSPCSTSSSSPGLHSFGHSPLTDSPDSEKESGYSHRKHTDNSPRTRTDRDPHRLFHLSEVLGSKEDMSDDNPCIRPTSKSRRFCDGLDRISSVRKEMHLTQHSPSRPPPLCSICKHKTPTFGKPPRRFTFKELQYATGNFSDANFLARGGYGSVHRGVLPDGQAVAVKQYRSESTQGDNEFCSEVEVLSCAQHRNLVMLIGYCVENSKRLLVYEFVCNGSLESHLHGSEVSVLQWSSRQKIAVGAARALRYLHEECRVGCIVHRDMRPNNILLTHDFEPMVGDFGLARWQPDGDMGVDTRVLGTFGYVAPEYAESGQITEKTDVYAFGIVLLVLVTGRKVIDLNRNRGEMCMMEWARHHLQRQDYEGMVDPRLRNHYSLPELTNMLHVASLCIDYNPAFRPRMSQVLRLLEDDSELCSPSSHGTMSSPRMLVDAKSRYARSDTLPKLGELRKQEVRRGSHSADLPPRAASGRRFKHGPSSQEAPAQNTKADNCLGTPLV